MLKKRLIFTLLLQRGVFQLSRNFSLQAVGNLDWLWKHYELSSISRSVDELVLLDVTRQPRDPDDFCQNLQKLSALCFMPIAAGGGITTVDHAYRLFDSGADKLVVNTALFDDPALVERLAGIFGSQSVVVSLDYRRGSEGLEVLAGNGKRSVGPLDDAIRLAEARGAGELYITSIDRDGTGQGYDLEVLTQVSELCRLPIVASGGVGDFHHFAEGLQLPSVTGASTANIFNFLGDGLTQAREYVSREIALARWDFRVLDRAVRPGPPLAT